MNTYLDQGKHAMTELGHTFGDEPMTERFESGVQGEKWPCVKCGNTLRVTMAGWGASGGATRCQPV